MDKPEQSRGLRKHCLTVAIATAFVALGLLALCGGTSQTVEAAPASQAFTSLSASGVYTIYVPLVMGTSSTGVYPDDPYYTEEWALEAVEAPQAWAITLGSPTTIIAVLDTGTDLDHSDLADKVRTDIDRDFVNDDFVADDDDVEGHGTHVSGIAAAATDNSTGVAGLAWETRILPIKVLDADGHGWSSDIVAGIYHAADNGAHVINMSLGGPSPCPGNVQAAVDYAYDRGVVLVAAAGNHGIQPNAEVFPANCEHVLGVGATEPNDSIASYSNYGDHVSVSAPGSLIYSTLNGGGYGYKSGTSMATPYVSGLAALLRARYPAYTPGEIASAILDNAVDLGAAGWDPYYGCGRIRAFQALSVGAHGSYPTCLGAQTWSAGTGEASAMASFAPGEIVVSFRAGAQARQAALRYGASAEFLPAVRAWRLRVPLGQEQATLARLRADPAVAYADLNYLVSAR